MALSDQHGELPDIPECDLLIVAGDNCLDYPKGHRDRIGSGPQTERQEQWFRDVWIPWRDRQPAKMCVLTWGNHDYCGEKIHAGANTVWHGPTTVSIIDAPFDDGDCAGNDGTKVDVGGLVLWLTPWSSQFRDWAFMGTEDQLADRYAAIPEGIDILVSHQPPNGYGDGVAAYDMDKRDYIHLGSSALLAAIERVKPRIVICGHIHGGFGESVITHTAPEGEYGGATTVYNVSLLNEAYQMVRQPTVIDL